MLKYESQSVLAGFAIEHPRLSISMALRRLERRALTCLKPQLLSVHCGGSSRFTLRPATYQAWSVQLPVRHSWPSRSFCSKPKSSDHDNDAVAPASETALSSEAFTDAPGVEAPGAKFVMLYTCTGKETCDVFLSPTD